MNSHVSIISRVAATTIRDIEGLKPESCGFCREECLTIPAKLQGSFESIESHLFVATDLAPTSWDGRCANVTGWDAICNRMKTVPNSKTTCFYRPGPDILSLLMKWDSSMKKMIITQYSAAQPGVLPWESPGVVPADRTEETFIFICAHRQRDERCGYCGSVLVDLLRQEFAKAAEANPKIQVSVYPCSHVGGHIYAGNVLVFNSTGAMCLGCVCPSDVADITKMVLSHNLNAAGTTLEHKVRQRVPK